jgi:processive 1,2-diacylglycerol beta-glucosyltransferase
VIKLYGLVGEITEEQLDFLIDNLEEEWADDQDYYVNRAMVDMLETKGADRQLIQMLRDAMGENEELEFVWVDTEEAFDEDDEDDGQ